MALLLNDRDKALQAAVYRSAQTSVTINSSAGAFRTAKNGGATSPTSITLTALPNNVFTVAATYTWHYALSSTPSNWVLIGTGITQTITSAVFLAAIATSSQITYRCTVTEPLLDTAYGFSTILYTVETSDSVDISITRTNVVLTCDYLGNIASFANTGASISVKRGNLSLLYSSTGGANTFKVAIDTGFLAGRTTDTETAVNGSTTYTLNGITALAEDGAKVVFVITVYDASGNAISPTFTKQIIYNKVAEGGVGANIYPSLTYDFAGATLPTNVRFQNNVNGVAAGTYALDDSGTTTRFTAAVADQGIVIENLNAVPVNNYLISLRVKLISGTWQGHVFFTNAGTPGFSGTAYTVIPNIIPNVWTTITIDMRTLTFGGTKYMTSNITSLRFDFSNDANAVFVLDYINIGRYGIAEATKSISKNAYVWSNKGMPPHTLTSTYSWITDSIVDYPTGVITGTTYTWTTTPGAAPATTTGYTLYQITTTITAVNTATSSDVNWTTASTNTIGYRLDGTIGPQGNSHRTAYIVLTGDANTVPAIPAAPTPAVGDKEPAGWSFSATSTLSTYQYLYQSDGTLTGVPGDLSSATSIAWGNPYLSNLKVGNLAAISANLGAITAGSIKIGDLGNSISRFTVDSDGKVNIKNAASGARMEITNNTIKIYDATRLRVHIGDLAA